MVECVFLVVVHRDSRIVVDVGHDDEMFAVDHSLVLLVF